MIEPIRALGLSMNGYGRVWYCARPTCGQPRLSAPLWAWLTYGPSSLEHGLLAGDHRQLSPPVTASEPGRTWQAWPARQPFVDDVTRHWPSDDRCNDQPTSMIEEVNQPVEVIDWRAIGGALDMWI